MTFSEFALFVRHASMRVRPALLGAAAAGAETGQALARSYIGHELADWPPLATRTITEKYEEGFGGQISATDPLLRTGKMRGSIEGRVVVVGDSVVVVIGSADPIARDQEVGTKTIPPRPFLAKAMLEMEPELLKGLGLVAEGIFHPGIWTSEGYTPPGTEQ